MKEVHRCPGAYCEGNPITKDESVCPVCELDRLWEAANLWGARLIARKKREARA